MQLKWSKSEFFSCEVWRFHTIFLIFFISRTIPRFKSHTFPVVNKSWFWQNKIFIHTNVHLKTTNWQNSRKFWQNHPNIFFPTSYNFSFPPSYFECKTLRRKISHFVSKPFHDNLFVNAYLTDCLNVLLEFRKFHFLSVLFHCFVVAW